VKPASSRSSTLATGRGITIVEWVEIARERRLAPRGLAHCDGMEQRRHGRHARAFENLARERIECLHADADARAAAQDERAARLLAQRARRHDHAQRPREQRGIPLRLRTGGIELGEQSRLDCARPGPEARPGGPGLSNDIARRVPARRDSGGHRAQAIDLVDKIYIFPGRRRTGQDEN
jgi:hypothetical protein